MKEVKWVVKRREKDGWREIAEGWAQVEEEHGLAKEEEVANLLAELMEYLPSDEELEGDYDSGYFGSAPYQTYYYRGKSGEYAITLYYYK